MATETHSVTTQVPIFNPNYRIITHVANVGEQPFAAWPLPADEVEPVMTVWEDYTATDQNYTILADATAGNITIQLPDVHLNDELELHIKKIDSTANTVVIIGIQLIDGSASVTLSNQEDVLNIIADADGHEWQILGDLP